MKKNIFLLFCSVATFLLVTGCALLVGGAAVGTGSYFYVTGEMERDYNAPYEKVWAACEKTLADMHATDVKPVKEIGQGTIYANIDGQEVRVNVYHMGQDAASVAIRVGVFGDKTASKMLHEKISENISAS